MNTVKTQFATAFMADFEEMTMTFKITEDYEVVPGEFAIVDKILYDQLIWTLKNLDPKSETYLGNIVTIVKQMQP